MSGLKVLGKAWTYLAGNEAIIFFPGWGTLDIILCTCLLLYLEYRQGRVLVLKASASSGGAIGGPFSRIGCNVPNIINHKDEVEMDYKL